MEKTWKLEFSALPISLYEVSRAVVEGALNDARKVFRLRQFGIS